MNLLGSYNMKKLKFNTFVLALFLTVSFSAKAIPTPEAVEPQYDDDGNPIIIEEEPVDERFPDFEVPKISTLELPENLGYVNKLT